MSPPQAFTGNLRARIKILSLNHAQVEWVDPEGTVVWKEECRPPEGFAFMSQIECQGDFNVRPGYFVDDMGKRHFVIKCETGRLGATFN